MAQSPNRPVPSPTVSVVSIVPAVLKFTVPPALRVIPLRLTVLPLETVRLDPPELTVSPVTACVFPVPPPAVGT